MFDHSWRRAGRIYDPRPDFATAGHWAQSHAQLPTVLVLEDRWRVFFSARNRQGKSCTTFVDISPEAPYSVLYRHPAPILPLGPPGTFDHDGVMPSCIIPHDGGHILYYTGWSLRPDVPYHLGIGMARSEDNGLTWTKVFDGPVLGTSAQDPYFVGSPWVEATAEGFRCWYLSGTGWVSGEDRPEPCYHIRSADSHNGTAWHDIGTIAVDYADDEEGGITRATVLPSESGWHMWFCRRAAHGYRTDPAKAYSIGYAWSADGRTWQRADHGSGFTGPRQGWENGMQAYPCMFLWQGRPHMIYNGNGFGFEGFGLAIADD